MNDKNLQHKQVLRFLLRCAALITMMLFLPVVTEAQTPDPIGSISYNSTLQAYEISSADNLKDFAVYVNGTGTYTTNTTETTAHDCSGMTFMVTGETISSSGMAAITSVFKGTFTAKANTNGVFPVITGLSHPVFSTATDATISNIMLKSVSFSQAGNVGAIACIVDGASRIYNCGILPTDPSFTSTSSVGSTNSYCGGLVGLLDGTSRVINCFSYANITGGSTVAGIVGYNNTTSTMSSIKTIVVNCMFYGEISSSCTTKYPVYGGEMIENSGSTAINNYNFYRGESTFDDNYSAVSNYNRSWPAEERNLRRFEYYRSLLNSNKRLCTFWVTDKVYGAQTNAPTDADEALIAKWVLDPSMAPYPILKKWGKYPSIINIDPTRVWNHHTEDASGNPVAPHWVNRTQANKWEGKKLGELSIDVKTGSYPGTLTGLTEKTITVTRVITDMDTLNYDYCYGKVQLPYYNEVFGTPGSNNYLTRYYGNYTNKVVTAWKIIAVTPDGSVQYHSFVKNWENGYNYADRYCTAKDIYDENDGRAFAQGGYYYVPEGVTKITIEAYWGDAFYLQGKGNALDRVSVCSYDAPNLKNYGYAFTPAGTLSTTMPYNSISIYNDFKTLMTAVKTNKTCNVYDQAVVLVGNYPMQAQNDIDMGNAGQGGFTFMSADFDMDNEPDFCFPLQWRNNYDRRPIMPIRFDFLPVPELGLAMRHNTYAYAIGIFVPQGHFEITETSFMHTTQFEYMSPNANVNINHQKPLIFNGGEFEQIVCHGNKNVTPAPQMAHTRNIIMGGHIWMKRFSPGSHTDQTAITRHCAVSIMGGEFPEFYLTGLYKTNINVNTAYNDNPHCYTNGGRFGIMAGAGMEAVKNSVYFEIDHSLIDEFYGGGINSNNPVGGDIHVTINNSIVLDKYCGGPKVGTSLTVTTDATGTIFNRYYGGGNGGTNLYREQIADKTPTDMPTETQWRNENGDYKYDKFTPIAGQGETVTYNSSKGYHAEYEFEVFNQSNGINTAAVARTYWHWAQFGTTQTGNVTNNLTRCEIKNNFYGGGYLGNVDGSVTSTLTDTRVYGKVFGAGYSAEIPSFPVQDKSDVTFPTRDNAGVCHNGSVGYRTDGTVVRQYTWCYKNTTTGAIYPNEVTAIPSGVSTSKPAFQFNGKWYCYTTVPLENLGLVSSVTLTLKGTTNVGTEGDINSGDVYGGGDKSAVSGNTIVTLEEGTNVLGNVYGGGNEGTVGGNSSVTIQDP